MHVQRTAPLAALGLAPLLLAGPLPSASAQLPIRSFDGTSTQPGDPSAGAAHTALARYAPAAYADGHDAPGGRERPLERAVSNLLCAEDEVLFAEGNASDWLWIWGQFLDHDLSLSERAAPEQALRVPIPLGDPHFDPEGTGAAVIPMGRSAHEHDGQGLRQQTNGISAWIDASMVYGSDAQRARALRALDGTGRLRTSVGDLLPPNDPLLANEGNGRPRGFFLAGDVRANENPALIAVQTLFVREHNHWAERFGELFPGSSGDLRYELARILVWSEIQAITYREFLPLLLGPDALPPYVGHDPAADGRIANEFSTVAFRVGHTMVSSELHRLQPDLSPWPSGGLPLEASFFAPALILADGVEPFLLGATRQRARRIDTLLVDGLRNLLFGRPGQGGMDLATLNLARAREHGICDYNGLRLAYGLTPLRAFGELTPDPDLAARFERLYGSLDDVDPWIACLAEEHLPGALVGESLHAILSDQFRRLRDADGHWYQRSLPPGLARFVDSQSLAVVLRRNTGLTWQIPDDPFRVPR